MEEKNHKAVSMDPRFETLSGTTLTGIRGSMSFAADKTMALWQAFMPKVNHIKNKVGVELYSVDVYPDAQFFEEFNPAREFEKWAAVKVAAADSLPADLETLDLPAGLYAVFLYKGEASKAAEAYRYIFSSWIPSSGYSLDDRPHFAVMGAKYVNDSPDSEEEIWIPIREKQEAINAK